MRNTFDGPPDHTFQGLRIAFLAIVIVLLFLTTRFVGVAGTPQSGHGADRAQLATAHGGL
jgi:hypothetical protein